ncbi:MAG: leucine-rich repeat domain-containing protein [Bacteroidaceae bacterium]|nr:leucine-rich repeat domain-containing protein [Bacteroidaceae bacterium]
MKNLKQLFTALLLLCSMAAMAETVTIDGITYDVITKAKQASVIAKETGNYSGSVVIPETIVHNDVTYSVTSIGDAAFRDCSGLTGITIPNSVTSIGYNAFWGCSKIKKVELDCTTIGSWFKENSSIEEIVLGNSVTSIGNSAFNGCSGLTSITIGNSVTSIEDWAFNVCSGLISITIPNSVTSIGFGAFAFCSGLTSVTIPNSVTSIGNQAFDRCSGLTSITIPNSVTSIGNFAFSGCSGLTSITIGNSVKSIGECAFLYCSGLTSIIIAEENPVYDSRNNSNAIIETSTNTLITGCKNTVIPNSVTTIGGSAFYCCSGLTSITIPNSVTSIGGGAFAFCSGLTSATIGSGVKSIGSSAFAICENLVDVYCLATIVPSTESDAFNESYPEYMTLHVPAEAINDYKTTEPWSSFGTIVTLDGEVVEPEEPEKPEEPEVKICETPIISYNSGKISIECDTPDAEFVTTVTNSYAKTYFTDVFDLSATYSISVYATAEGYENSDTVNATLCWIENGESDEDDTTNIIKIPAVAVLVTSANGAVTVNCSLEGENVEVYTTDGTFVGTAVIANGSVTIQSGLSKGSVAIVKIGDKSVKIVVD